jgi:gp16 family phage-associated protein
MSTPQIVKCNFSKFGLSIKDWATKNGFNEQLVYAVLNGRNQGSRGESFRIAVALGLRDAPDAQEAPAYLRPLLDERASKEASER